MLMIDLCKPERRLPITAEEADRIFRLAVELARAKPEVKVRIPVGPKRGDRAVLDGELLAHDDTAVF